MHISNFFFFLEKLSVSSAHTLISEAMSHQAICVATEVCYLFIHKKSLKLPLLAMDYYHNFQVKILIYYYYDN